MTHDWALLIALGLAQQGAWSASAALIRFPATFTLSSAGFAQPAGASDAGANPSQGSFPEAAPPTSPDLPESSGADAVEGAASGATAAEESKGPEPQPESVAQPSIDMSEERESTKEASEGSPKRPGLQRTVWGLSLRVGGTFASEDLLTATYTNGSSETLTTGGGVNFFIGTFLIPLKYDRHSLGFGFEGGAKLSSIGQGSNATVSFSRTVFVPRVQYGFELTPGIHWITSAGPQYETDITLEAKGALVGSTTFDTAWGYLGETGILLDVGLFGLDLTLRHTRIDYALPDGPSISGNSWGVFCSLNLGILRTENLSARPDNGE